MKLFDLLRRGISVSPDKPAIRHGKKEISFRDLHAAAHAVGQFLYKVDPDDKGKVAILWENSIEYAISFFGATAANKVVVPLDTSLGSDRLEDIIAQCRPSCLIVQSKFLPKIIEIIRENDFFCLILTDALDKLDSKTTRVESLPDIYNNLSSIESRKIYKVTDDGSMKLTDMGDSPHELAAIFYTSGSTGEPKGVMLSHRNLVSNTAATLEYLGLTQADSALVVLPFYYIYGNSLLLTHIACGGCLVIENRFAFAQVVLNSLRDSAITGFSGVPSSFIMLLNMDRFKSDQFPHLRYMAQAGGAMAPEVIRRLLERFPHTEIFIMYGQTEASPRIAYLPPEMLAGNIGTVGVPIPGVDIKLVDENDQSVDNGMEGEISVGGNGVMMGYYDQPDEEKQVLKNGRLLTGDLAIKDKNGLLKIVSRKKEIIKAGGYRVSAREIEEILLEHPDVLEVAVIGLPDDILGEAIKAFVVPRAGTALSESDMSDHTRTHLPSYRRPKYFEFLDSLPKFESGKIDKKSLK